MRDRVNFVVTNSQWDDNFDEVGPFHRKLQLSYSIVKMVSSYIAQYPVLGTAQSTLHFTLAVLFNQTPTQLPWEVSSHTAINVQRLLIQISTTVYNQVFVHTLE